jgi:aryl-alcohol dehydrogenase-like predicted oxidoreductase
MTAASACNDMERHRLAGRLSTVLSGLCAGDGAGGSDSAVLALRDLQRSPLSVSNLMVGCAFNTVNSDRSGLTGAAEKDAIAAVVAAVELGVHDIDVSASYGLGLSEEYVGSGLAAAGVPGDLSSWVHVWTKGGPELIRQKAAPEQPVHRGFKGERTTAVDFSAHGARVAFKESLGRLGLARLAGFRIHDPETNDVDAALAPDGFLAGLRQLRSEGMIGEVSLGMNSNRPATKANILRLLR